MGRYDRFSGAFQSAFKPFDEAGPEVQVAPFAPGEASTGAGIIRALTAVAGARRAQANWRLDQKYRNQSRYKDLLETQMLEKKLGEPDYEQGRLNESIRYHDLMSKNFRDRTTAMGTRKPASPADKAANASLFKLALDAFDKQGETYADEAIRTPRVGPGGKKLPPIADVGQSLARLLKTAKPSEQLKYAQALGVAPMKEIVTDPNTGQGTARLVLDANGNYQFDSKDVASAISSWTAQRRAGLVNQWRSENAPRRSQYQNALMNTTFGSVGEPPSDPLEDAALELFGSQ